MYRCSECQLQFAPLIDLECHVREVHVSHKPYSCSRCPTRWPYPTLESAWQHVKQNHPGGANILITMNEDFDLKEAELKRIMYVSTHNTMQCETDNEQAQITEQQHVENPPEKIDNKPIEVDSNEKATKKTCGTSTANEGSSSAFDKQIKEERPTTPAKTFSIIPVHPATSSKPKTPPPVTNSSRSNVDPKNDTAAVTKSEEEVNREIEATRAMLLLKKKPKQRILPPVRDQTNMSTSASTLKTNPGIHSRSDSWKLLCHNTNMPQQSSDDIFCNTVHRNPWDRARPVLITNAPAVRSATVTSPNACSGSPQVFGRTKRKRHHRSRSPVIDRCSSSPRSPDTRSTSHSLENRENNYGKKPRHEFKTTTNMKIKISGNGSDTNSSNQSHAYRWDSYDANDCDDDDDDDDYDEESGEQRQVLTGRLGDAAGQKSGELLQCRYCSYSTKSWSIDAHFARHHKRMDCYYCQAVVYGHRNLFKHLEQLHGWRWKCKVCQMTFARRQIYEAHIKAAHQSEQSRLFC